MTTTQRHKPTTKTQNEHNETPDDNETKEQQKTRNDQDEK